MSHAEEQDTPRPAGAYRAPMAAALGTVEELTAGGGQNYADGVGSYLDKKSRIGADDEE